MVCIKARQMDNTLRRVFPDDDKSRRETPSDSNTGNTQSEHSRGEDLDPGSHVCATQRASIHCLSGSSGSYSPWWHNQKFSRCGERELTFVCGVAVEHLPRSTGRWGSPPQLVPCPAVRASTGQLHGQALTGSPRSGGDSAPSAAAAASRRD